MGGFAIETNTVTYTMAQKSGTIDKLPILTVKKMGPHFTVGDTRYSWPGGAATFSPNGKEVIAGDNEVSILREENMSKAYFSYHMDITIPYWKLDCVMVATKDGEQLPIIMDRRLVAAGTEELNKPLEKCVD